MTDLAKIKRLELSLSGSSSLKVLSSWWRQIPPPKTIQRLNLDKNCDPAIYELGVKKFMRWRPGFPSRTMCSMGYPLTDKKSRRGAFSLCMDKTRCMAWLPIWDLKTPCLIPRRAPAFKTSPVKILEGGEPLALWAKPSLRWLQRPSSLGLVEPTLLTQKNLSIHTAVKSRITASGFIWSSS